MHSCTRHARLVSRLIVNSHALGGLGSVSDSMDVVLVIDLVDLATIQSKAATIIRLLLTALMCYESIYRCFDRLNS